MTDVEQHEARLQIQANAFTTSGQGSLTTAESASLAAQYICAAEMNADHELLMHPAFYSYRLHHAVCDAPFTIERRRERQGWRHPCKSGQQNPSEERGVGKNRVPRQEGKFFFQVCALCQATKRAEGICGDCAYSQKESTLKASINSMLPTCDDKGVFFTDDVDAYRPGNSSSLQCKEVGRRKAEEQVVVTWAYSVALVWLV